MYIKKGLRLKMALKPFFFVFRSCLPGVGSCHTCVHNFGAAYFAQANALFCDSIRQAGQDPSGDSTRPNFTNRARGNTRGKCLGERRTRRTWPKLEKWQYDILRQILILDIVRYAALDHAVRPRRVWRVRFRVIHWCWSFLCSLFSTLICN